MTNIRSSSTRWLRTPKPVQSFRAPEVSAKCVGAWLVAANAADSGYLLPAQSARSDLDAYALPEERGREYSCPRTETDQG